LDLVHYARYLLLFNLGYAHQHFLLFGNTILLTRKAEKVIFNNVLESVWDCLGF
jgi:hypothetical protein